MATGSGGSSAREVFGSKWGFVLAAVGSAVGLGNMWRFSYVAAEGGGAAFVLLYIVMVALIGIPLMLSELVVGRKTRLSPVGALRTLGGKGWSYLGMLFVLVGFLILSYYSVIAGWTMRYAVESLVMGFPGDSGARFEAMASGNAATMWHLAFMVITIGIVMVGVKKGIERASLILMPLLFFIVLGLAFWAATLEGSGAGYAFYLRPDLSELMNPQVIRQAAAQAFFSLSLGMGAMLTFASYLGKDEDLNEQAVTISGADFGVAFVAGLVVFPVIFSLGLQNSVSESTVGALFIALPGAFEAMGGVGRVVGTLFFVALAVGALTSAISLLEVVTSSIIDEFGVSRKKAAVGMGILIAGFGIFSARSLDVLGLVDQIAGEFLLVVGALSMSIFVGWRMKDPAAELARGAAPHFAKLAPTVITLVKFVLPPVIGIVLYFQAEATLGMIRGMFFSG